MTKMTVSDLIDCLLWLKVGGLLNAFCNSELKAIGIMEVVFSTEFIALAAGKQQVGEHLCFSPLTSSPGKQQEEMAQVRLQAVRS